MRKIVKTAAIALVGSCLMLPMDAYSSSKPKEANLVVLYTTDVHGACLPFDFNKNAPATTSLANVSTYVNKVRENDADAVMLFDTGDMLQGQPSMYYYNYVDTTDEHVYASVANFMKYDAIGVGNHDIETGEAVYNGRLPKQLNMPWLCANAIDTRTGKPMFQPYAVINRKGVKVVVLGMITPNISAWLPKALWQNLEFEDMVECAKKWVPIIQKKEKPDVLIGLFHSGGDYTAGGSDLDTYKNENGGVPVAVKVPGFDLILLGHDHQQRIMDVVNVAGDTVKVLDARTQASCVGRADIHLTRKGKGYDVKVNTELVSMNDYKPDEKFDITFEPYVKKVNKYVDEPIGTLTSNLYGEPGLYGPSDFMDLIHDVQLWATAADVSFASVLSPKAFIPAGPLTMRQLFTLYRYENQLFKLNMTGEEIKKYLEYGFAHQYNQMRSGDDDLLNFENGKIAWPTFNFTSAAGIKYVVDVSKPEGERVTIVSMSDGKPFDPATTYLVAVNSYQACGGGGFIPEGLGWDDAKLAERTLTTSAKDVRQYVADYIKHHGAVTPHSRGDWKVVPESWWEAGMAHDKLKISSNQR